MGGVPRPSRLVSFWQLPLPPRDGRNLALAASYLFPFPSPSPVLPFPLTVYLDNNIETIRPRHSRAWLSEALPWPLNGEGNGLIPEEDWEPFRPAPKFPTFALGTGWSLGTRRSKKCNNQRRQHGQ